MHTHKCGLGVGGFEALMRNEPASGCGHVWEHEDKEGEPTSNATHFCPKCGVGPWTLQYSPEACARRGLPYETPTQVGHDNPEFQRKCEMAVMQVHARNSVMVKDLLGLIHQIYGSRR